MHPFVAPSICKSSWQSKTQEARLHSGLAFFAQLQRFFYLPSTGITDTTPQKSANEEKMFWKVTLPTAIIVLQKMFARLTSQAFFAFNCRVQPRYLKLG